MDKKAELTVDNLFGYRIINPMAILYRDKKTGRVLLSPRERFYCTQCANKILLTKGEARKRIKGSKSGLLFCSKKCSRTYLMNKRYKDGYKGPWYGKKRKDMEGNKHGAGHSPWNLGMNWKEFRGANHPSWKGEEVGYSALHTWVKREFGEPKECDFCGVVKTTRSTVQWANVSGKYRRVINDWITLCAKCHYHYDRYGETP